MKSLARWRIPLVLLLALSACVKTVLPYVRISSSQPTYQVQPGDTLYLIAKRHGLDYRLLARRNRIRPPYTIYVGQRLYLRGSAPPPSYLPLPKPSSGADKRAGRRHGSGDRPRRIPARSGGRDGVHLVWPLDGRVVAPFGKNGGKIHDGIDIAAPEGTPIRAAAAGEVVYANRRIAGYGNLIIIRHAHDVFTAYAHNQRNLVRQGMRVKQGDLIARVGRTGHARRPALHFEVRRGTTPVNPLAYLPKKKR